MIQLTVRRAAAAVAALGSALVVALAGAPPAGAQVGIPDLQVSATFDKAAYDSGDVVRVTLTITNAGDGAAEDVYVLEEWPSGLQLDPPSWGDLSYGGEVARLAPGETRVVELDGTIRDPSTGTVTFSGRFWSGYYDRNYDDNAFALSAPVRLTYGDFGGAVVDDRNGNGLADPGEGIAGVQVFLRGGAPYWFYEQVTDLNGRFFFDNLPSGRYASSYYSEDGWVVGPEYPNEDTWVIGEAGITDAVVLAVRPLSDKLQVTASFELDSYQAGDEAHVTLALRNKTGSALTGIHAHCNGVGNSNQFNGVGPGWAAFDQSGPGVTLEAGETRTFEVYETVPDGAFEYGWVGLGCEIGPGAGFGTRGLPWAEARAKVPGATTTAQARIVYDADGDGWIEDGEGIADTRVALLDYGTHHAVVTGTSDAEGRFEFTGIPAGTYVLRVIGPWQPAGNQAVVFDATVRYYPFEWTFSLEPRGTR